MQNGAARSIGKRELDEILIANEADDQRGGLHRPLIEETLVLVEILRLLRCVWDCKESYFNRDWRTLCDALDLYTRRNNLEIRPDFHRYCMVLFGNKADSHQGVEDFASSVYEIAKAEIQSFVKPRRAPPMQPVHASLFRPHALDVTGLCHPDSIFQPPFAGLAHLPWQDVSGAYVSHLSIPQLMLEVADAGIELSGLVVNLGANNGMCYAGDGMFDSANCLAAVGWGGVFIEASDELFELAREVYTRFRDRSSVQLSRPEVRWSGWHSITDGGRNVSKLEHLWLQLPVKNIYVVNEVLTPSTVASIVKDAADYPADLDDVDLLKVDIDASDCEFAANLLFMRPKVVHLEVQPGIPPPLAYMQNFNHSQYINGVNRLQDMKWTGCSLAAAVDVLKGYRLLQLEDADALFIRDDLVHLFPQAKQDYVAIWRAHYFCRAAAPYSGMPMGWADPALPLSTRLAWIEAASKHQGRLYVSDISL